MNIKCRIKNSGFVRVLAFAVVMLFLVSSCGSSYSVRQMKERKQAEQFGAYPYTTNKKK